MTSRGRRIVFTWKQLLELSVVLFLNWSPCGAVNVVEVANERCRFQDIDGVSMRLVRDGEGVTYYNIKENHPVGTRVVQLAFAGVPNDIKLRAHTGNNLLRFRPIQRDLVLLRALDLTKDGDDVIHVVLNCTTLDVNVRMRITLLVIDLNNHRPAFKNSVYRMTISELTDVGDTVLQVTATDRDLRNQAFDYSVIPSNYSSYFNINTTDGGLTLAASLDYETLANFSLILVVRDKHQVTNGTLDPHWWNTASLSVSVIDEDDMAPQFEGTTFYMATVEAHAPTGTPLKVTPTIHAFDGDRSLNVSVEYTIINKKGDEPHPLFAISNSTGVVALRRSVAANEGEMVFLMLMAVQMDNPTKRAYALLRASVTAPNKHRPLFSQNAEEVRVVEGQPAGLYLLTVSATDDDTTAELIYRLCPATKKCLKYFQIDPEMGILKTARSLNFEEHEDHYVTVKVSDGLYEDTLHVHVSVVDVNEHTPTFEQPTYMFDVMMSEPYGSIHVGQLHAKDGDRNPSLYFSLRYAPAMFSIDDVGVLSAVVSAQSVDGLYNFTAVVTDGRGARKRQNTSLVSVRTRTRSIKQLTKVGVLNLIVPWTLGVGGILIVLINVTVCILQSRQQTSVVIGDKCGQRPAKQRKSSLLSAVVNDWLWTSLGMLDDLCDAESCHTTRLSRDDGLLMFRSYNAGHLKRTAVGRTSGAKAHASDGAKAHANDGAKAHASDAADANVTDDANHTNAVEANKYDDDTKYVDTNGVDNARDLVEMPNCSFEQIQRCD